MKKRCFTYQSDPNLEERFMDDIVGLLDEHDVEESLKRRVCLTVSEAFTNALRHGNNSDPTRKITICLSINRNQISADITDQGTNGLRSIMKKSAPGPLSESGRGVDLMYHYAARTRFEETSQGGLRVILEFDRESQEVS
ncbi:MAG: ATP-binding protein [bacterium]|nr:ATP-binding protein [bacterium]